MKYFIAISLLLANVTSFCQNTFPSSGNVGIGTSTPSNRLEISGSTFNRVSAIVTADVQTGFQALKQGTNATDWELYVPASSKDFRFYNSAVGDIISLTSGGNVGINLTLPTAKLEVNQTGGGSGQNVALKTWAGNSNNYFGNSQIQFSYGGGGGYNHAIKSRHNSGGLAGNSIDFYLWQPGDAINGEGSLSTLTLDGGKVGIGITTPVTKLHVNGALRIEGASGGVVGSGTGSRIELSSGGTTSIEENWGINLIGNDGSPVKIRNAALLVGYTSSSAGWGTGGNLLVQGNVGIGTTTPDAKLSVSGQVHAQEVKVSIAVPGPDYVFEKDYPLASLEDIKTYIDQNKHLPEVPSAKEMEKNGVQLGEMNMLLLKKIEELTLYMIEQKEEMRNLKSTNERLGDKIITLETALLNKK